MLDTFLENLGAQPLLPQSHIDYLLSLKASGFNPKVIYDVGACVLHWTNIASRIWPDATIYVFDAYPYAENLYKKRKIEYHIGILSNKDDDVKKFYQNIMNPGGNSYLQELHNNSALFPEDKAVEMKTATLDTIVKQRGFPPPDLIKCDVQGAEIDIVSGAKETLKNTKYMILELQHISYNKGAPMADQAIEVLKKDNWVCIAPRFSAAVVDADYCFTRNM
jgi:FkbM family methyltransferase